MTDTTITETEQLAATGQTPPVAADAAPIEVAPAGIESAEGVGATVSRTLYRHAGTGEIDPAAWPAANLTSLDGAPLYYFSGDVHPGDVNGASEAWVVVPAEQVAVTPVVQAPVVEPPVVTTPTVEPTPAPVHVEPEETQVVLPAAHGTVSANNGVVTTVYEV